MLPAGPAFSHLRKLNARRILIRAAEAGTIRDLRCTMETCLCPYGSSYFEPVSPELSDWMPTNDHHPVMKCDGGRETADNSRLAHRLCNRVGYADTVGIPVTGDLARVDAALRHALQRTGR